MGSSRTRAQARVPGIGRRTLNHCATREAQNFYSYDMVLFCKFQQLSLIRCFWVKQHKFWWVSNSSNCQGFKYWVIFMKIKGQGRQVGCFIWQRVPAKGSVDCSRSKYISSSNTGTSLGSPCSATREATAMRSPRTETKSSPRSPRLEKARAQQRRPDAAKNHSINQFIY